MMWLFCTTLARQEFEYGDPIARGALKSARNEEPSSRGPFSSGLTSGDSGLQLNLEIALSGVSAKVKPSQLAFQPVKSALRRRMT